MIDPANTYVIANPHGRGGWVGLNWHRLSAEIRAELGDGVRFLQTQSIGDGVRCAREAIDAGATTLVSFGGDGTHSEITDGIMRAGAGTGVSLGILHAGTGGDFRRMLTNTEDLSAACRSIARTEPVTVDCGWVEYVTEGGEARGRHFLNIASLGIGGLVDRFVNESKHRLRGGPAYALATLRANSVYQPAEVELEVDGEPLGVFRISNICVCNGRWAGGGMMFAPDARLTDGLLDVVVLESASTLRSLPVMRGLYKGTHTRSKLVRVFQGQRVKVTPQRHTAYMDIDGEAPGIAPASFQVRAGALRVHGVRPEFL
ncbi:MAG: diacylglycerol kinase family lipid kinase [Polyangiales bacterium]|nr:diacylglycerol kinase family lipid kinase [Myxococcales bacterium]MCB9657208.1 diacylglycerol kinase family lipid kinase [Sandaracinaceae bacterium]